MRMSKYLTLSHENVEACLVLSPHNIKLSFFNLEWRLNSRHQLKKTTWTLALWPTTLWCLMITMPKFNFFFQTSFYFQPVLFFFRFCEAGGLTIIHKRTNDMVTHGVIPDARLMLIIFKLAISSHLKY